MLGLVVRLFVAAAVVGGFWLFLLGLALVVFSLLLGLRPRLRVVVSASMLRRPCR